MPRKVSQQARASFASEISPIVKVFLLTIKHKSLPTPIYLSSDATERLPEYENAYENQIVYGTRSNGKTYLYCGFQAALLNDESGSIPQVEITIPNAHRSIIESIEMMGSGPVECGLQLVLAESPDIVEADISGLYLTKITYDESTISGTLSRDILFDEPFPSRTFTPEEWPFIYL